MNQATTSMPRRKGPPMALRIDTPAIIPQIAFTTESCSTSTSAASSAVSETEPFPFRPLSTLPRPMRNMKKLSLTLPAIDSTNTSLVAPLVESETKAAFDDSLQKQRPRRPSVASLPTTSINTLLHRKEEDGSPTVPYLDGPVQILPGVWLGAEDNARDWKGLIDRGIKSILNVAKEVISPLDTAAAQPLRPCASTPNLARKASHPQKQPTSPTFYPAHLASGRPSMHYLKLEWSHGETDLVETGFPEAFAFVDAALDRDEGVLIHCQCGISRSATLVIALVMRASAQCTPSVPPEVWQLKGYQGAYSFVKEKSKWVGPNMSLIYQLLDYERALRSGNASPTPSERSSMAAEEEEEWGRKRRMMDEASSESDDIEHDSSEVAREARALDKAMEDRIIARKSSASSLASSSVGMGPVWLSRYTERKRAGSTISNLTSSGSIISEDLMEEDGDRISPRKHFAFDSGSSRYRTSSNELGSCSSSSESRCDGLSSTLRAAPFTPLTARPLGTPKASQSSPPPTATTSSFKLPPAPSPRPKKVKRRPPPLGLPPAGIDEPLSAPASIQPIPPRSRTVSRKPSSPPTHLRNQKIPFPAANPKYTPPAVSSPSRTLFVFPPDSSQRARTPSTMTLVSNPFGAVPFPSRSPRISMSRTHGRTRSFICVASLPTPTIACSRVDAKGWIGIE